MTQCNYIRAGSTTNAENALKKLCAQNSHFGRNINPNGVTNTSVFFIITDLLALTDNNDIIAFFNDVLCNNNIANAPDNNHSMCNFVAQMSLDIVEAWKICKDARPTTSSIRLDWDILQSVERYLRDANLRTKLFITNQDRFLKMLPSSANYVGECNTCAPSTSTACERLPYFHTYLTTLLDFTAQYGTKTGFRKFITSEATASGDLKQDGAFFLMKDVTSYNYTGNIQNFEGKISDKIPNLGVAYECIDCAYDIEVSGDTIIDYKSVGCSWSLAGKKEQQFRQYLQAWNDGSKANQPIVYFKYIFNISKITEAQARQRFYNLLQSNPTKYFDINQAFFTRFNYPLNNLQSFVNRNNVINFINAIDKTHPIFDFVQMKP